MLSNTLKDFLTSAAAKALATYGGEGINVVPVSMIRVLDQNIWLFDFFMDKTRNNLTSESSAKVSLAAWTDMKGVQIKAIAHYVTEGGQFDEATAWVKTQNPARVLKGVIILTPVSVHDVSPGGAFAKQDLTT